jgi:hypothetical protein
MAIPSVNMLSNLVGGAIPNVLNAHNEFANKAHLRKINAINEFYAPESTKADIASKLAYARLVGLQPLGKLLASEPAYANLPDAEKEAINRRFIEAGGGHANGNNSLNRMPNDETSVPRMGSDIGNSLSGWFVDKLKNAFTANQQPMNAFSNPMKQQNPPSTQTNNSLNNYNGENNNNAEQWKAFDEWKASPEGQKKIADEGINYMPPEEELENFIRKKQTQNSNNSNFATKTGEFKGQVEQGKLEGKNRAEARNEIGKSQLALSNAGAALNNVTKIVQTPAWKNMRNKIPAFQDKQLSLLKITGTDEEKRLIGKWEGATQSVIANTVAGMGTRHLVREYDLAERQKINNSDTIQSAQGKLENAIELHDIAEQKNNIIDNLLARGINESEAVRQANKMVDVGAIEKRTEQLLADEITDEDIDTTAKNNGISREEVIKRLKKEGRYHG